MSVKKDVPQGEDRNEDVRRDRVYPDRGTIRRLPPARSRFDRRRPAGVAHRERVGGRRDLRRAGRPAELSTSSRRAKDKEKIA